MKEPSHTCQVCSHLFRGAKPNSKYCSKKCSHKGWKLVSKVKRKERRKMKSEDRKQNGWKDKINKEGYFVKQIETYKDKIIDYEGPTGKAYIGIAKTPLMKNDNGIGFKGVILQDETRQFLQCSACGRWLKRLCNSHLKKCSGMTKDEYKEKFDLYPGEGLVSDETALELTRTFVCNDLNQPRTKATRTAEAIEKNKQSNRRARQSMEWKNKYGTCPEQMKSRLREFILNNQELPGPGNRGRLLYKTLYNHFKNPNEGLRHYGLPYRIRRGTSVQIVFPDLTVYKYNYNQWHNRQELFETMKQKCPILQ